MSKLYERLSKSNGIGNRDWGSLVYSILLWYNLGGVDMSGKIDYNHHQAEMIYLSIMKTLRDEGIEVEQKFQDLSGELIDGHHEAVHLGDLLEKLYEFITYGEVL